MKTPLAVLIVEDSESDAQLIARLLEKAGYSLTIQVVDDEVQMRNAMEQTTWDIVISDYSMPQFDGPAALKLLQEKGLDIPFIVVSGTMGEETAVAMMKMGAHDYLMKNNLARLAPAVSRELRDAEMRRAGKRAEVELRESAEKHKAILQTAMDGFWLVDTQGRIIEVNETYCRMSGYSQQELRSMRISDLESVESAEATAERIQKIMSRGQDRFETRHHRKDGSVFDVEIAVQYRPVEGGRMAVFLHDITERKRAGDALRESELRYRSLFENMLNGFAYCQMIFDGDRPQDFVFLAVNAAFESQTGLKNAVGRKVTEVIPRIQKADPGFIEICGRVAHTRAAEKFETYLESLSMWLAVAVYSPAKDYFVAVFDVITERKLSEAALRESEEQFRSLAEAMPQIVWATRPDGWNIYYNQQWVDYTGLTLEESYGHGWNFPFHPDDRQRAWDAWQTAMKTTGIYSLECRLRRADGVYRWWLIRGVPLLDQSGEILKWYGTCTDIDGIKQSEQERELNEARLAEAQALAKIGSWETDLSTLAVIWSKELYRIFEIDPASFHSSHTAFLEFVHPQDRAYVDAAFRASINTQSFHTIEHRIVTPGGFVKFVEERWRILHDSQERPLRAVGTCQDITERKRAEKERSKLLDQLQQAQKMESVGRLAGGVAHDFNNMLGVILGYTDIALMQLNPKKPLFSELKEIRLAAERSADLTRQLLAFARQQAIAPKVLDLNETIESMLKMLRRLIGEDIELAWLPGAAVWTVKMDPSQIDQILANLCVNARDAIAGVGKITIETGNVSIDKAYCLDHDEFVPGDYSFMAVSDNGCGMDREILDKLFEPFFTTKELGKGTGLGLATVYGIVKQNKGVINVYSERCHGTTFRISLPRYESEAEQPEEEIPTTIPRGNEIILLVEDELSILKMTTTMLQQLGYTVLAASSPDEATRIARDHSKEIHLLMTDVVMPGMNGRDLSQIISSTYPNLKRIFTSGYTADVIAHQGVLDQGVHFIQKPFSLKDLAVKVREVLESR